MPHQPLQAPFSERVIYDELIYEPIFDNCSAATLLHIARTCRASHRAITAYCRVAFNIDRLLSRFFPSPVPLCSVICRARHEHSRIFDRTRAFRSLQARTGTLISGSCALQFFDRTVYPESDLDLYVHMRHRREVGRWLVQEGYTYEPTSHQDQNLELEIAKVYEHEQPTLMEKYSRDESCICQVLNFKRCVLDAKRSSVDDRGEHPRAGFRSTEEHSELRVQLIVAKRTPMEVILGFHSACVMNVISYNKAYYLFPQGTLEDRLSMFATSPSGGLQSQESDRYQRAITKYTERGFTLVNPTALSFVRGAGITSKGPQGSPLTCADGFPPIVPRVRPPHPSSASSMPVSSATVAASRSIPVYAESRRTPQKPTFRLGERWIEDSESWVLPLPLTGVVLPQATMEKSLPSVRDPVSICNREVGCEYGAHGVTMHFCFLKIECLKYTYLVQSAELAEHLYLEVHKRAWHMVQIERPPLSVGQIYLDAELMELCEEFRNRCNGQLR
ncbi:hypothetical protein C8Q70DRAFT_179032 [Cubamyces menziesii]|nr:hypothetical protein C8Q70DRAFT_179032 [Cubamyces menziesii]